MTMDESTLPIDRFAELRKDCLIASAHNPDVRSKLAFKRIAVTGGTGFLGTWIAETIAALNDEYDLGISLDLYARNIGDWEKKYPHLSNRLDLRLYTQDVRSPFVFQSNTHFIIHAAGVPNNRVHASDPLRVIETTVNGIKNVLDAAYQQDNLVRFINISSGLVSGVSNQHGPLAETSFYPIPSGQLHLVYLDAKRSAESIAAVYRSKYRMPISTIRPFTFVGPYQELDRPWAINSFMGDILRGQDIRIHGDGSVRRSYLYGSDAAWWILVTLIKGIDAGVYNLGSSTPISHIQLTELLCKRITPTPRIVINTTPSSNSYQGDLFPSVTHTENSLNVMETCPLEHAINKTLRWFLSA